MTTTVKFKLLSESAKKPTKAHNEDAGFDIYSAQAGTVEPKGWLDFRTDVAMQPPAGYYGKFASKSGLAMKYDIHSFHGTVDNNYRGGMVVRLFNYSEKPFRVEIGDKITQLVLIPYFVGTGEIVEELDDTERGENGFGSTGRK